MNLTRPTAPIVVSVAKTPAVDCARGVYPTLILTNVSTLPTSLIYWMASASADFPVTITPSNYGVPSGNPEAVTISGVRPPTSHTHEIVVTFVEPFLEPGPIPSQTVALRC